MIRHRGLPLLSVLLLLLFACDGGPGRRTPLRNGVVILIDTCRYDEVGRETAAGPVTPGIDRFTEGATRFTRATSPAPWTLPAVASLLTSVYPTAHGALGRYPEFSRIREEVPTAAEFLRASGFATSAFVNVAFLDPLLGLDRGFDLYDYVGGANRKIRRAGETVDRAIEWIDRNREERFFLFIHLFDPHMDFDPVEPWLSRFQEGEANGLEAPFTGVSHWKKEKKITPGIRDFARSLYRAEIAAVDAGIGRFLSHLDSTGLSGTTAVVLASDHGEEFWDHGAFEHGHTLYEELIHVPLVIRAPGLAGEAEVGSRVSLVDVVPTLFELLGVEAPAVTDGESLLPLMEGRLPDRPRYCFSEALLYGYEWKAVVGDRFKFSWDEERQIGALFDLAADPWESENLFGRDPDRVREMSTVLLEWIRAMQARTGGTLQSGQVVDMEEEVVEQLRSLGYVD